ncbi:MAG: serine/threonine-protein kinase [Verrucomicrobiota bacterium JB022]|nr:serine/threonine-protein kinase [Verrucomicrobiota bacterium JB022]
MKEAGKEEEAIFTTAAEMVDPTKVSAYLDRACAGRAELRARVEALLEAHREADRFFEEGASVVRLSDTFTLLKRRVRSSVLPDQGGRLDDEAIGSRIGRYKLLEKIGEGGCGAVFLAEQEEPVLRHVALKIIRGGMESRSVIARFEAERQALAMMDHPNIARVFDAGATDKGAPYFVMEHVRGVRITDYCDQHRLSIRQRLHLFIQVCHAIQHAHQKGIIHGDIKPSNIMIAQHDGVAQPKVIDFGIARAAEARRGERQTLSTSALWIGTPAYMSPEQVEVGELDVDTRSDIYSLGVLLFQLLTGRTPLEGRLPEEAGLEEVRRALREYTPLRPSVALAALPPEALQAVAEQRQTTPARLLAHLRGDLDCIALKALEKDRRYRYETANGLAMDAQRFLNHDPVLAHPAGWVYSFRKLVRRNRAVFFASAMVTTILLAALGVSTHLFLNEREARQRAVQAEQQQARLRQEAEEREMVTQAALMVSQERYPEADELLKGVTLTDSTMEGAAVYRAVGEWHAINERWAKAAECFGVLLRINELEGADVRTLDYLELGPVLIELGDREAYDRFRRIAVDRFPAAGSFSDRIVKISLLAPAEATLLEDLQEYADFTTQVSIEAAASGDTFQAAWQCMSIALFEYRSSDYQAAIDWCLRSVEYSDSNAPRTVTVKAIQAMAEARLGRIDSARASLALATELTETRNPNRADRGTPVLGFWFDWAFARIILREATTLVEERSMGI